MNKVALLGVLALVSVAGCVGQDIVPATTTTTTTTTAVGDGAKEFAIDITHSSGYGLTEIKVKKDDTVRLLLTSSPVEHKHGIEIDQFHVHEIVTVSPGGDPQVVEFVADAAGEFRIFCGAQTCESVGGFGPHAHWPEAKLIVEE